MVTRKRMRVMTVEVVVLAMMVEVEIVVWR